MVGRTPRGGGEEVREVPQGEKGSGTRLASQGTSRASEASSTGGDTEEDKASHTTKAKVKVGRPDAHPDEQGEGEVAVKSEVEESEEKREAESTPGVREVSDRSPGQEEEEEEKRRESPEKKKRKAQESKASFRLRRGAEEVDRLRALQWLVRVAPDQDIPVRRLRTRRLEGH